MKAEILKNPKYITASLAAVIIICLIMLISTASSYMRDQQQINQLGTALQAQQQSDNPAEDYFSRQRQHARQLWRDNPFTQRRPLDAIEGIVGDEVLIQGRWYQPGDEVNETRIVAVEPAYITIEWEGRTMELYPILTGQVAQGQSSRPSRDSQGDARQRPQRQPESEQPEDPQDPQPASVPQQRRPDPEQLRERWRNMDPDQREALRQQFRRR